MNFVTRFLAGLQLIAQLAPAIVAASAGLPIRIRRITIKAGSTYVISGAGPITASGEYPDDLNVQVVQ